MAAKLNCRLSDVTGDVISQKTQTLSTHMACLALEISANPLLACPVALSNGIKSGLRCRRKEHMNSETQAPVSILAQANEQNLYIFLSAESKYITFPGCDCACCWILYYRPEPCEHDLVSSADLCCPLSRACPGWSFCGSSQDLNISHAVARRTYFWGLCMHWQQWAQDQAILVNIRLPPWT